MSEQKDEFDEFEEYCLSNLGIAKEIPIFSVNAVVIKAITRAISENLSMYRRIKAKNVCKNCLHLRQVNHRLLQCTELSNFTDDKFFVDIYEKETLSCNRFQIKTDALTGQT